MLQFINKHYRIVFDELWYHYIIFISSQIKNIHLTPEIFYFNFSPDFMLSHVKYKVSVCLDNMENINTEFPTVLS